MRASLRTHLSRRPTGVLLAAVVALASTAVTVSTATAVPLADPLATAPDLGPNVTIVDPSMPTAEIQALLDELAAAQTDDEMGSNRHAVLFLPGEYGSGAEPLQARVGYYTEIAGLGAQPQDVSIDGKIEVYNRCLEDGGTSYCVALNNFWRTIANLSLQVNAAGQDGCRASANFWAVSQAVSMRRLDISGANLSLMDYCTAGPQFASGGFIADSRLPFVINGSQQQWLTRNTEVAGWSNGVWNQVFAGVEGAPAETGFPSPPYTTLEQTPISREKPYLYVDDEGRWLVRVPSAATQTRGISWDEGLTAGRSIPIEQFFIARPGDPIGRMNAALARGQHLLLTPGVYDATSSIQVKRAGSVVLGLGHATLTATDGAIPVRVSDEDGIVVAGVTIDAGDTESRLLMQVGKPNSRASVDPANPITLSDVYFRVGGPHIGKVDTALVVNSDHTLIDHTWVWRADHGVEDFTAGVFGDTDRWNTNIGRTGVVVNGDDVTATGLFVEHFQRYNTVWNGERGEVVLYQNELPYDPPSQADWTQPDGTLGFPGYKVGENVAQHVLHGGGVYVFNRNDPSIITENGFEVPETPGVRLRHIMTVNLGAGTIQHVVNGVGSQVDNSNTGTPAYVIEYPTP
jgi:hypothetical protein